jgi:hypothetical protein
LPAVLWNDKLWKHSRPIDSLKFSNSSYFHFQIIETLNTSKKCLAAAYELLLKSYCRNFDSHLLKNELSVVYLLEEFLESSISYLLKYLIASPQTWVWHYQKQKICLITNHSKNQCICSAVILYFEKIPYLPKQHAVSVWTKLSLLTN